MAAGVQLSGDLWPNVGAGLGGAAGEVMSGASVAASAMVPGVGWVQLGMQLLSGLFAGDSDQTGTASATGGNLNTSGWAVGKGSADGGDLASSEGGAWPWYAWAALTIGAVVLIRKVA